MLEILEKYNNKPYVFFFYKSWANFSKRSVWLKLLSLIQNVQKMLETDTIHELLMEIYKQSLKGQYGLDCVIFWWKFAKNIGKQNSDYIYTPYSSSDYNRFFIR